MSGIIEKLKHIEPENRRRQIMKILSWNVAGIRARFKDKYLVFLEKGEYDVICFQETKAEEKLQWRELHSDKALLLRESLRFSPRIR